METEKYLTFEEFESGLDRIRQSPKDNGVLGLIGRRPNFNEREVLKEAELDSEVGLVGDNWKARGSSRTTDFFRHPETRISISSAIIEVIEISHMGCKNLSLVSDSEAMKFVNSEVGKQLHLRGINARVIQPGTIRVGDLIGKI